MSYPLGLSTLFPPPSSFPNSSNMSMLYYSVAAVGVAAILLTICNFIIIKRRCDMQLQAAARPNRRTDRLLATTGMYENSSGNFLLSSFKYKKREEEKEEGVDCECVTCLLAFEEGEEVRKLPCCNYSFRALCIDMWLHSHVNCPICRMAMEPLAQRLLTKNSPEGLLEFGMSV